MPSVATNCAGSLHFREAIAAVAFVLPRLGRRAFLSLSSAILRFRLVNIVAPTGIEMADTGNHCFWPTPSWFLSTSPAE